MQIIRRMHLIVLLVIWVLIVIIDLAIQQYLYEASLNPIEYLQQSSNHASRQSLKIITDLFSGAVIFPLSVLLFFNLGSYTNAFYIFIAFAFYGYFTGLLKLIYHDPRPFFSSDDIKAYSCSSGYGNPSGHSMGTAMSTLLIFFIFKSKYSWRQQRALLAILLTCFVVFSLLVGFSRVYLGVHSFNQVIYGWEWGIWLVFLLHTVLYDRIQIKMKRILQKHTNKCKDFAVFNIVLFLILYTILLVTYFIAKYAYQEYEEIWLVRVKKDCDNGGPYFADKSFSDGSAIFMQIGAVCGVILQRVGFKNKFSMQNWNQTTKCRTFARVLLNIVLLIVPGLMYILITGKNSHFGVLYVFKVVVPFFLYGFIQFGLVRRLSVACKLGKNIQGRRNQNDYGQKGIQDEQNKESHQIAQEQNGDQL